MIAPVVNRQIRTWRAQDVERLRAVLAVVAPGVGLTGELAPLRRMRANLGNVSRANGNEFRFLWRYLAPICLGALLLLALGHLGSAWSAHLGHGRPGTWITTRVTCSKPDSRTWIGEFIPADGTDGRSRVQMALGSPTPGYVGEPVAAVDTGDPDKVYPVGGGPGWLVDCAGAGAIALLLAVWTRTVPLALIRRRTARRRAAGE